MGVLEVTLACGPFDRTWALASGRVRPEGVDLNYVTLPPEELFWRMTVHGEFDAAEFSLGAMTILLGRGDRRFVGIPVFPSRFFRHSSIFVNVHSGIKRPEDLKGRRVGVPDYTMTANTWIRGFLEHDFAILHMPTIGHDCVLLPVPTVLDPAGLYHVRGRIVYGSAARPLLSPGVPGSNTKR